ncbi:MAG: RNA methyltransferase, partial [Bacteroidales bacterium]|nr:RNA methyltransferase [Bacteroidales bacterium]
MISINQQKLIRSLQQKKQREKQALFLLEGDKIITDLLSTREMNDENTVLICATAEWLKNRSAIGSPLLKSITEAGREELKKLSAFQTPPEVMAVVKIPKAIFAPEILKSDLTLVFDQVRDPGNLGTIIRTADWFGIRNIVCSHGSVDQYNNKVVQASMGSVIRVQVHYSDLTELFNHAARLKIPVYGTVMDGDDLFDTPVKKPGIIVFGNESTGIDPLYETFFKAKIRIPDFPAGKSATESLNIASSVAVICS